MTFSENGFILDDKTMKTKDEEHSLKKCSAIANEDEVIRRNSENFRKEFILGKNNIFQRIRSYEDAPRSSVGSSLLHFPEVPAHLRFNKYVLGHYRPLLDIRGCIASLAYWHNETINILTHAVPIIFILLLIPRILPWDVITIPFLPVIHVAACLAPWVGSTFYHLFMCHNTGQTVYAFLLKFDLFGIWFTQTLGALVTICSAIHCFEYQTKRLLLVFYILICILSLYQAMTVSTTWGRRFAFTAPFSIRVLCLLLRLSPWGGGAPNTTYYVVMQDLLAIIGGYIGAVNIPEKWYPGKMDLVFNSHHIMHVLVVAAVYQMHKAAELDLVWMSTGTVCHSK